MTSTTRARAPRRAQFGITLTERGASLLRSQADRLKVRPTTLAAQLLEQALDDRTAPPDHGRELLEAVRAEVASLARAHHNVSLKLLRTAGQMSTVEVGEWAKRYLTGRGPPPR